MKIIIISLALLAAGSAFANEASDEYANRPMTSRSTTDRETVRAEFLAARENGTLPDTGEAASLYTTPKVSGGLGVRQEVKNQAWQAARQRTIHELM